MMMKLHLLLAHWFLSLSLLLIAVVEEEVEEEKQHLGWLIVCVAVVWMLIQTRMMMTLSEV